MKDIEVKIGKFIWIITYNEDTELYTVDYTRGGFDYDNDIYITKDIKNVLSDINNIIINYLWKE